MLRAVVFVALLASCRVTLETEPNPECPEYADVTGLAQIHARIFQGSCLGSGCHRDDSQLSELHLQSNPHAALVGVPSEIEANRILVVPGQPKQSYLLYMIEQVAPADMDPPAAAVPPTDEEEFMPVDFSPMCREKREAIERWIAEGALDN